MSVTWHIVDLWQYYVLCIRLGVIDVTDQTQYGALPVPCVPVWVTLAALVAHRHTYAPPRCRTSQYRRTSTTISVSMWNDLTDSVFDIVDLAGFKNWANTFLWV